MVGHLLARERHGGPRLVRADPAGQRGAGMRPPRQLCAPGQHVLRARAAAAS
jgi:hypothetical protein